MKQRSRAMRSSAWLGFGVLALALAIPAEAAQPVAVAGAAPNRAPNGTRQMNVTITGAGFVAGTRAAFSNPGIYVERTVWSSPSTVTATINVDAAPGAYDLSVHNPDGGASTCEACFTVVEGPAVNTATPAAAVQGTQALNILIQGRGFTGLSSVTFSGGGITVNAASPAGDGTLIANVSITSTAPIGARDITVRTNDGHVGTCAGCFTIQPPPPAATAARPASRGQGARAQDIIVIGKGFVEGSGVSFAGSGITVLATSYVSPTNLLARIDIDPLAAPGARNIEVTTAGGSATCERCFTINPGPKVAVVAPPEQQTGATNKNVTINGSGFVQGARATFGEGITVHQTMYSSPTTVTANISISHEAAASPRSVTVFNPDAGAGMCTDCFTVTSTPTITAVNVNQFLVTGAAPASGSAGSSSQNITILGGPFYAGARAWFSTPDAAQAIYVERTVWQSPNALLANISIPWNATPGARDITVRNPDGTTSTCSACFTISGGHGVDSVTPDNGTQGSSNKAVVIQGSGFNGVTNVLFSGGGVHVRRVTPSGAGRITAMIDITTAAATGARNVTVLTADGASSTCTGCFTVTGQAMAITDVSPDSAAQGANQRTVTVSGRNFLSDATVAFGNGVTVTNVDYVHAGTLRATVNVASTAQLGPRDVVVTSGGATADCRACFTVAPAPQVQSVAPNRKPTGSMNSDITLHGAGFAQGATAWFSNAGITVNRITYVSPTSLLLNISIPLSAAEGARDVTVRNPDGTQATCAQCFTVTTGSV